MATLTFSAQDFKNYKKGDKRHLFYNKSCEQADQIKIHADGCFPEELLRCRRPNEPVSVFEYRKKIFVAITKPAFTKVFSSLQKIRRSNDWNIDYGNKENEFTKIAEGEKLSDYCEKQFPYFKSVTNWLFNLELRKYMIDPNAVVFVLPLNLATPENELLQPFPYIFESQLVIDYAENDFCVLINPSGSPYTDSAGNYKIGDSYYFVTRERIQRYDQIDGRGNFRIGYDYVHNLPFLPISKLGGVLVDQVEGQFFYESRISGMIPELDEAIREYSDLQAAKVLHIYPERWEYSNIECPTCNGKHRVPNPAWFDGCSDTIPNWITCEACHGTGIYVNSGPYNKMLVGPSDGLAGNQPIPPAGFIEKDVEIIKIQDEGVDKHIYKAFAAINFEFLNNTPLNQSGVAKETDKDELNNTVNSFAEDIVAVMDFVYKCIAYYRYGFLYSYSSQIEDMLPNIAVPVNYDLLGNSTAQKALTDAKTAGANPVILNALESEYASKVFYSNPEVKEVLLLELNLDPLPNIDEADKILMLSNKGITLITYVVSSNIHAYTQRALVENANFSKLKIQDQKVIIEKYAQETIDSNTAKMQVINAVNQTGLNSVA